MQLSDGSFAGAMTYTNGKTMKITLQKVKEEELETKITAVKSGASIGSHHSTFR